MSGDTSIPPKVVKRIAKLLRLAGPVKTPEEKTAKKMAEELMDRWKVELDVDGASFDNEEPQEYAQIQFIVRHVHCLPWRWTLVEALASIYEVVIRSTKDVKGRYFIWIQGDAAQVRTMRMHYILLAGEVELMVSLMRREHLRHVYALGMARQIWSILIEYQNRAKRMARTAPQDAPTDTGIQWGSDEVWNTENRYINALPPNTSYEHNPYALALIPRQRIRVGYPKESRAKQKESLDLDLPMDAQVRGSNLADGAYLLNKWVRSIPGVLSDPIADLKQVPKRVKTTLLRVGIQYVGELIAMRADELITLPGVGPKSVKSIETALKSVGGLHLRPADPFASELETEDE